MPWTTPKTDFVSGNILTAAQMNAIGENLNSIGGAWTSYTPTWTNVTVGNGTQSSAYIAAGKLYVVRLQLTFGTTTSVSGAPEFTFPGGVSVKSTINSLLPLGGATLYDNGGGAYWANVYKSSTVDSRGRFLSLNASGTYGIAGGVDATTPVTWGNTDQWVAQFVFEAA